MNVRTVKRTPLELARFYTVAKNISLKGQCLKYAFKFDLAQGEKSYSALHKKSVVTYHDPFYAYNFFSLGEPVQIFFRHRTLI